VISRQIKGFAMSEADVELQALRDSVRGVLAQEADSARVHRLFDEGALLDRELWRTVSGLGWPALAVPEARGGLGLGAIEIAGVFEELGRRLAPIPFLGSVLAARAIAVGGDAAQGARWLPAIAEGSVLCAVSPPFGAQGRRPAVREDQGRLILAGEAADLLQGAEADLLVIEAADERGETVHLVIEKADGAEIILERTVDQTRHLARARLDGLSLPADRRLAAAPALAEALATEAALALACDAVGGAEAIFEMTIEYLKTRQQFGKPIGSFQALKHRCADHKVAMAAAAAVVTEAVRLTAEGDPAAAHMAHVAKAYACEVYAALAEDAVQMHGGIGFTWEHDAHLYLKRAKLDQALFGGTAAHLDRAADLLVAA
jgi:alkylation response protein AidB-like acyl-CoA dehydrogenase